MSDRRRRPAKRKALNRVHVKAMEDEIERLIAVLDLVEPDPELEENGDLEPSLGNSHLGEPDLELDAADDEPNLGSLDRAMNQTLWSECNAYNAEAALERAFDRTALEAAAASEDLKRSEAASAVLEDWLRTYGWLAGTGQKLTGPATDAVDAMDAAIEGDKPVARPQAIPRGL